MVQKEPKRRGRPRAYDPDVARAVESFWQAGYAATSLDDLSEATGMNRPSLYGAFGDKHDLYLSALAHYWELSRAAMREALAYDRPLRQALREIDEAFEARIRFAKDRGELRRGADPTALAVVASAVLHTLALRARAGASRAALQAIANAGVDFICGSS